MALDMDSIQMALELEEKLKRAEVSKRNNQQKPKPRPSRNLEKDLFRWQMFHIQKKQAFPSLTTIVSGESHTCRTEFEKLKSIHLRKMEVPKVHKGRYLVCKCIIEPYAIASTNVLMEDLNGDVEEVAFYNFCYDFTRCDWLKPGTIMVIKEPYLCYGSQIQDASIRVDSPSDVIFVDPTDFEFLQKIGAQKWHVNMTKNVEIIREVGKKCFANKDYEGALQWYNRAIRYNPDLPIFYLNKASTCLRSGYVQIAYDAAKTGMERGGEREKALHRMGLAAYGLRNWILANENFELLLKEFPGNPEANKELKRTKERIKESETGKFDFKKMHVASKNGQQEFDVADYKSPSIEIGQIPEKGRGILATDDIKKGTLLLVSKAFAYGSEKDVSAHLTSINLVQKQADSTSTKLQVIRTIDNLRKNPKKAHEIYALYSGDEKTQNESIPEGVIDTALIEKISMHNRFGSDIFKPSQMSEDKTTLLFILPSYFNHSCIANAYRIIYGDVMFVYACTNIKKGDEITLYYTTPLESYAERKDKLEKVWGFKCKCGLCELDRNDENYASRTKTLKQFTDFALSTKSNPQQALVRGKPILKQIRDSYTNRTEHKLQLAEMLIVMGALNNRTMNIKPILECLNEVLELVSDEFERILDIPIVLLNTAGCYMQLDQEEKARQLAQKAFKISFCTDKDHFKLIYPSAKNFL